MDNQVKMTDKQFLKALVSSVCCILICMGCLVGTTWAWFAASVAQEEQVQMAVWELRTTVTDKTTAAQVLPAQGQFSLVPGTYTVDLSFTSDAFGDSFSAADTVYVVMQQVKGGVTEKFSIKLTLPAGNSFQIPEYFADTDTRLSFYFTRMDPGLTSLNTVSFAQPVQPAPVQQETEPVQQETQPVQQETEPVETTN